MFRVSAPPHPVEGLEPRNPRLVHPSTLDPGLVWARHTGTTPEVCVAFGLSRVLVLLDVTTAVDLARQVDAFLDGPGGPGTVMAAAHGGSVHLTSVKHGIVFVDLVGHDGGTHRHITGPTELDRLVDKLLEAATTLGWTPATETA